MSCLCGLSDVLEQVKIVQLQSVGLSRHMSALVSLPAESDDSKQEQLDDSRQEQLDDSRQEQLDDWSQLCRSGITLSLPFSVTVSGETFSLQFCSVY